MALVRSARWLAPLAALALAAPLVAAPPAAVEAAAASQTVPRIYLSADGATVYIVGTLTDDAFLRFDALLQNAPKARRVYLASPGGLTLEGRLIAALVRKRRLDTYVETYCASACTQVFVAGRERILGPEGQLGFHQAVGVDLSGETSALAATSNRRLTPLTVFGINGNDTLRLAYEQAGIEAPFIAKALARGHDDMWLPGADELAAGKVVTRRAARTEVAPPEGTHGRAEIAGLVENRPVWRGARKLLPTAHAQALDEVWRRANTGSDLASAVASGRGAIVIAAWPLLAAASDSLLDRMLQLYAGSARIQRAQGYPMCRESIDSDTTAPQSQLDASFEAREDELLVELFGGAEHGKPLSVSDARKVFERDVAPAMLKSYLAADLTSSSASCRLGFKIFEAIDDLPAKKRVTAYRALLTLPEAEAS